MPVVSVLALLDALARRVVLAAVRVGPAPARFVRAGAGAEELAVDEAVILRAVAVPALRDALAFSTMLERRPVRGFAGDAGRAMRDFAGEAGRAGRRELEEAGERTCVVVLVRARRLGFSSTASFSFPGPASSSLYTKKAH